MTHNLVDTIGGTIFCRPGLRLHKLVWVIVGLSALLLWAGCVPVPIPPTPQNATETPTATLTPTETALPTPTRLPAVTETAPGPTLPATPTRLYTPTGGYYTESKVRYLHIRTTFAYDSHQAGGITSTIECFYDETNTRCLYPPIVPVYPPAHCGLDPNGDDIAGCWCFINPERTAYIPCASVKKVGES